jgi:hypothetical protein
MSGPRAIIRLVGVYDADGSTWGEVRYWMRSRLRGDHCSLCDITHGARCERPEWVTARDALAVPFETFHRDDQPDAVRAASAGIVPIVVAETATGVVVVLRPDELAACGPSPEAMLGAIESRLAQLDLVWPADADGSDADGSAADGAQDALGRPQR